MEPFYRIEEFIKAIIDDSDAPMSAECRIEQYLTDILEERVSTLEPVFRIEKFLAKISGVDIDIPEPSNKAEKYLAAIAGEEIIPPANPNSRLEHFLAEWYEKGMTVVTSSGSIAQFVGRSYSRIRSLSVKLDPIQTGTPWTGSEYDQKPYNLRSIRDAGVSRYGNSEIDEITGGTVVWNQLLKEMNSTNFIRSSSTGATVSIADGVATITASAQYAGIINSSTNRPSIPTGHKVLCSVDVKLSSAVSDAVKTYWNEQNTTAIPASAVTTWQTLATISSWDDTKLSSVRVHDYRASGFDSYQVKNSVLFDLTVMFGSAIADYIYTLEQNTAGAGVAWFRKLFPKDYYAYNAGSLQSVNTSAHKTYNADSTILGNYALDGSLTLRGVAKLDAANKLYYDGDAYLAIGAVVRKYGVADLGSLSWNASSSPTADGSTAYVASISDMATDGSNQDMVSDVCVPGPTKWVSGMTVNTMIRNAGRVIVAASAAPTAGHLIYPLATTTTESADPYAAIQSIDPDGTEEYVDAGVAAGSRDVAIPVGHRTNYANVCPISGRTGANVYVSPKNTLWSKYKLYVDTGVANELMPVGEQITDKWKNTSGTEISFPWDVVHYTSGGDAFLKLHHAAPEALQFDAPEAIYYFDGTEPAGTYHIEIGSNYGTGWVSGHSIQFTLTAAPDEGDQLFIDCGTSYANDPAGGRAWMVYDAGGTTVKQSGTTSEGTGGTSLGTIGNVNAHRTNGRLNAISRVVYGYGRWSQSAMRQYFNSAEVSWWTMKNPWDRPPAQASTIRGFLCGFSQDFLDHLEETEVVTALNTQEGFAEATETTLDKIFLPSLEQMYINPQLAGVEGESWDYYKALAEEAGLPGKFQQYQTYPILISYNASNTSSAVSVFLRSCTRGYATNEWLVHYSGNVNGYYYACNAYRGCPACKFKKSVPNGARYEADWTSKGTVYGGSIELISGILKKKPYYYPYNGETLVGPWMSSMNEYEQGETPTIGSQVVDLGGEDIEFSIERHSVATLLGPNNVWSDSGDIEALVVIGIA